MYFEDRMAGSKNHHLVSSVQSFALPLNVIFKARNHLKFRNVKLRNILLILYDLSLLKVLRLSVDKIPIF